MKLVTNFPNQIIACAVLVIFLVQANSTFAQVIQYRDPQKPDKGHWQLFTNAATQTTNVQFYDANKQLLYEEVISNGLIKLTDRNINKINEAFDQVAERKLLAANINLKPLTSADYKKLANRNSLERRRGEESVISKQNAAVGIQAHAYKVGNKSDFNLTIQNPNQERIYIYVFNKVNKNVYWEKTDKPNYRRNFNFEGMQDAGYSLVVTSADKRYNYTRKIETEPSTRVQPVEHSVPAFVSSTKSDY